MYRQYRREPGGRPERLARLLRRREQAEPRRRRHRTGLRRTPLRHDRRRRPTRARARARPRRRDRGCGRGRGRGRAAGRGRAPRRTRRRRRARHPLRGAPARIVENMEASLGVPTATSVRTVPAKLLEVNRQILNNHLARTGRGKVSFTHLIAFAVLEGARRGPGDELRRSGTPTASRRSSTTSTSTSGSRSTSSDATARARCSSRTSSTPTPSTSPAFHAAYEELIRKVRDDKLSPDDFAGTTGTITNPGMIGTVHSVPRLMPGQGFIIGVGADRATPPSTRAPTRTPSPGSASARSSRSRAPTTTAIIQGAESGEFLAVHARPPARRRRLLRRDLPELRRAVRAGAVERRRRPLDDPSAATEKVVARAPAHQHVPGARPPHREPRPARAHGAAAPIPSSTSSTTASRSGTSTASSRRAGSARHLDRDDAAARHPRACSATRTRARSASSTCTSRSRTRRSGSRSASRRPREPTDDEKRRILERLNAAEAFERFLHTKYLGQKRFSLEGAESLDPDARRAADRRGRRRASTRSCSACAHRGRLNVLANMVGKSYGQIFREFEGELDPSSAQGSGDVKYHVGATGKHTSPSGNEIVVTLASNPSHLEAVDPVVEGMARAEEDRAATTTRDEVLPVLVHGDAAFAGQGVVAETLQPLRGPGLRRRRHRPRRREQPARVHDRARDRAARACTRPTSPRWCRRRSST